jgi:amidophosphoribosyltransferase
LCLFEHVYFARPDSLVYGKSINQSRHKMGRRLAIEQPADADIVCPVPDSGVAASIGYAAESGLSFRFGLVRNHYIGRTFIEPRHPFGRLGVRIKLNPVRDLIKGRRVVLIDDSIVRGRRPKRSWLWFVMRVQKRFTYASVVANDQPLLLRVDTPNKSELIAANMSVEEIRDFIGADSLGYLSLEGMIEASGMSPNESCVACWNGQYPTRITRDAETMWEREHESVPTEG